jgi:hypothetical protein
LKSGLKHAFAVDPPGPAEPTPPQQEAVDWFCRQVARRHLATPALIALEMSRPLNFVGAQAMQFFSPGVWAVVRQQTYQQYKHFATYLERRGSLDYLARRIEHFEEESELAKRTAPMTDGQPADDPDGPRRDPGTGP